MFTGIITDIGTLTSRSDEGDVRLRLHCHYNMEDVALGASIACDGICLSVTQKGDGWFEVAASAETVACTTLGSWEIGRRINLERALRLGDELGGHMVSGHVDGLGTLLSRTVVGDSQVLVFSAPPALMRFIAPKGSVTLNGISLTVNTVADNQFSVNIIWHTQCETTMGDVAKGHAVNLEVDLIARYLSRLQEVA